MHCLMEAVKNELISTLHMHVDSVETVEQHVYYS